MQRISRIKSDCRRKVAEIWDWISTLRNWHRCRLMKTLMSRHQCWLQDHHQLTESNKLNRRLLRLTYANNNICSIHSSYRQDHHKQVQMWPRRQHLICHHSGPPTITVLTQILGSKHKTNLNERRNTTVRHLLIEILGINLPLNQQHTTITEVAKETHATQDIRKKNKTVGIQNITTKWTLTIITENRLKLKTDVINGKSELKEQKTLPSPSI